MRRRAVLFFLGLIRPLSCSEALKRTSFLFGIATGFPVDGCVVVCAGIQAVMKEPNPRSSTLPVYTMSSEMRSRTR